MISLNQYNGARVGVLGLGKAGEAAVTAFLAGGASVYAWDDSENGRKRLSAAHPQAVIQPPSGWPWKELAALALSPGIPLTHPKPHDAVMMAMQAGCPILGDVELLYAACPKARYIGITGTNGKSTTTTLIGHILASAGVTSQVGGNLGTPALALEPLGENGVYVLEMSSYQLDLLRTVRFTITVLLNITPDHLDRHGNMKGYMAAKSHIFDRQTEGDVAIIAVDDDYTRRIAESDWLAGQGVRIVRASAAQDMPEGVSASKGILQDNAFGGYRIDLRGIATLTGQHNWQNAACAYAAARACGVSAEEAESAMRSFSGLRHRLQLAAIIDGVRFINDSKATNAEATANALAPYKHIYWIAGGKPKAGGIESLKPYFRQIAHAFLIGEAEEAFAHTLESNVPYTRCGTLKAALAAAAEAAFADGMKDAVVLLSPACASFDQFANFEQRGDVFCDLVEKLAESRKQAVRHAV